MKYAFQLSGLIILMQCTLLQAQIAIRTSFEEADGYSVGNIHNVSGWKVTSGTAAVVSDEEFLFDGEQALRTSATSSALQAEHIAFASNASGLGWGSVVYADMVVKPVTLPSVNYAITGYDLASSNHRSFMVEFQPNSKLKIYDGSSGWATQPTYTINEWIRLSFRIDNGAGTYQLAINGTALDKVFVFREIRNSATTFDYHSIRFSMSTGNCNVAIDKLYVGTDALEDVSFSASEVFFSVNVQQPAAGTIQLNPVKEQYLMNEEVTASLTLPDGYEFMGWTGDLAGIDNPRTFRVQKNMTIGATIADTNAPGIVRSVSNVSQFKDALSKMNPGDTVLVMNGDYNLGSTKITRGGTSSRPIIIKSANLHGARITGKSALTFSYQNYVTYEGFNFDVEPVSTIIKMEGCSYVRITRNTFRMQKLTDAQSSKWITIGDLWENPVCNSHHNRIDHNIFDGKYDAGAWLVIDGSHGTVPDISKNDRIDHNIFRNNTPRVANEKETIRIGVSDLSLQNSHTIVENNLFEDCDGDPEIVSVKSCSNIIRNNTFRRCLGTLSLRHGHNSIVSGNFFFGEGKTALFNGSEIGCGGIRVYGMNHQIFNNYFEGLTGSKWDAAITITNGDVANTSTSLTSHFLPENVVFAHNTLINNVSNIEIGFDNNGNYGRAPKNCKLINNLIVADINPVVKAYSSASLAGVEFANNLIHVTGSASIGLTDFTATQLVTVNPFIQKTSCRTGAECNYSTKHAIYKLSAGSPAIDPELVVAIVTSDIDGQALINSRDIGADEYNENATITNAPMDSTTAGPFAPENYEVEFFTVNGIRFTSSNLFTVYPNPVQGEVKMVSPVLVDGHVNIQVYDSSGRLTETIGSVVQNGNCSFDIQTKGLVLLRIENANQFYHIKLFSN
ncbi:MAG: chondroitinase-B domain-containing protein [Paludibacter sp.]|jgi:hypothetical protein|nr:chondroitinase-B domain-containing protein [Paludibacter sp.]